jgi:quercetin dioxygenase-like cupin family protein
MRSLSSIDLSAELARLAADLAAETGPVPPRPGPGPVPAVPGYRSAPALAVPGYRPGPAPADDPAWSIPLLVSPEAEAWLLGWPAGLVTPAHGHGGATMAVTVVEGALSEECLDATIWTTCRRTTWRAGATTVFPRGHVHRLGAASDEPAVAVHAWSWPARSGGRAAGRLRPLRAGGAGGRGPRGRGDAVEPARAGLGRGGDGCRPGHPADGALDLLHVRDRVPG